MGIKTRVGTWIVNKLEPSNLIDPKQSTAIATATNEQVAVVPEQAKDVEIVSGTFMPDIQINASPDSARVHTERIRKTVESFSDDRMVGLEWLVVKFFTFLAYLLPPFIAWIVGSAIGQVWAGTFNFWNPYSLYSYGISIGLEMMIPICGYSVTVAAKRATKDRSQIWIPIVLGMFFLGLATGNSFAQMFLMENHVKLSASDFKGQASVYFRSFGPLLIDTIATVFLTVCTVKSQKKFIKDMAEKEEAINAVARSEIKVEAAFDQANRDRENARVEQERKRMDNELLKELTRRRNDDTLGGDSGSSKGKYGGGW